MEFQIVTYVTDNLILSTLQLLRGSWTYLGIVMLTLLVAPDTTIVC